MIMKIRQRGWEYSHNVTAAILVFQTNPVRVGLFSYVKNFFCSHKFAWMLATRVLNTLYTKNVKFESDLLATNEEYRYAKSPNFREVCMVGANLCLHHTNVWKISFRLLHFVTVLYILSFFLQTQSRNSSKLTFNMNLTLLVISFSVFHWVMVLQQDTKIF